MPTRYVQNDHCKSLGDCHMFGKIVFVRMCLQAYWPDGLPRRGSLTPFSFGRVLSETVVSVTYLITIGRTNLEDRKILYGFWIKHIEGNAHDARLWHCCHVQKNLMLQILIVESNSTVHRFTASSLLDLYGETWQFLYKSNPEFNDGFLHTKLYCTGCRHCMPLRDDSIV